MPDPLTQLPAAMLQWSPWAHTHTSFSTIHYVLFIKSAIWMTPSQQYLTRLPASSPNFASVKTVLISTQYTHAQNCMWSCVLTFSWCHLVSTLPHTTSVSFSHIVIKWCSGYHLILLTALLSNANFLEAKNDSEKGGNCLINNWPTKPYHITATSA